MRQNVFGKQVKKSEKNFKKGIDKWGEIW